MRASVLRKLLRQAIRLDAEFALESILLERFALFLKVYSHPAKIAASVMFGKALRIASRTRKRGSPSEKAVEQLGDMALLLYLSDFAKGQCNALAQSIILRRLFKPVFLARAVGPPPRGDSLRRAYEAQREKYRSLGLFHPMGREAAEAALGKKSGIEPGKLAIYCVGKASGRQKVRHYIDYEHGRATAVNEGASPHRQMLDRHIALWSIYVFTDQDVYRKARDKLKMEAEAYFGLTNELDVDRMQGMLF